MQAQASEEEMYVVLDSWVRLTAPGLFTDLMSRALTPLLDAAGLKANDVAPQDAGLALDRQGIGSTDGETGEGTEEEVILQVQEQVLRAVASRQDWLILHGSVVTRSSQSLLIVADGGASHAPLAVALTALGFECVSVGAAAFDGRSLVPLPLPLGFRLEPDELHDLQAAGVETEDTLERLSPTLFRTRRSARAPGLTHVLFQETHPGARALVRPISGTAARTRLYHALIATPEGRSPFAIAAGVMRHTRGVVLALGEVPRALEQLGRLLPRWQMSANGSSEAIAVPEHRDP